MINTAEIDRLYCLIINLKNQIADQEYRIRKAKLELTKVETAQNALGQQRQAFLTKLDHENYQIERMMTVSSLKVAQGYGQSMRDEFVGFCNRRSRAQESFAQIDAKLSRLHEQTQQVIANAKRVISNNYAAISALQMKIQQLKLMG